MNICELIQAVGVDNVRIQNLDSCADALNWTAKSGTKVTFRTEVGLSRQGLDKLGLVIWLPRQEAQRAIAKARGEQP